MSNCTFYLYSFIPYVLGFCILVSHANYLENFRKISHIAHDILRIFLEYSQNIMCYLKYFSEILGYLLLTKFPRYSNYPAVLYRFSYTKVAYTWSGIRPSVALVFPAGNVRERRCLTITLPQCPTTKITLQE